MNGQLTFAYSLANENAYPLTCHAGCQFSLSHKNLRESVSRQPDNRAW